MNTRKPPHKKYFSGDIKGYKECLLSDFDRNERFTKLVNTLFFSNSSSIVDWIKGIEGERFVSAKQSKLVSVTKLWNREEIEKIGFSSDVFGLDQSELYYFFSKKEYETYDEAKEDFPGFYYVFDENIFYSIDLLLLNSLGDYKENQKESGVYQKKISDNFYIKLSRTIQITKSSGISEYHFPDISVAIDGKEYFFFGESDVRSLLFLPGTSFLFFYWESCSLVYDDDGKVIGATRKNDEPVIYHDKENGKYIITNSHERLICYNKYILLLIELYRHYFRVFEKWLIQLLT